MSEGSLVAVIAAIGSVLAGLGALITAFYSFSNNRPYIEVKEKIKTSTKNGNIYLYYTTIKLKNTGSRTAYNVRINTGDEYKYIRLSPGESAKTKINPLIENEKISYQHFPKVKFPYYKSNIPTGYFESEDPKIGDDLYSIDGRKALRLLLKRAGSIKSKDDYISFKIEKERIGSKVSFLVEDLNKNFVRLGSYFKNNPHESSMFLNDFITLSLKIDKDKYSYSISRKNFNKIFKKNFNSLSFDLFGNIYSIKSSVNSVVKNMKKFEIGTEVLDKDIIVSRSRTPDQSYVYLSKDNEELFSSIDLKNKYLRENDEYIVISNSREDFVVCSNRSTNFYEITIIDKKNKTIISSDLMFTENNLKLNDSQYHDLLDSINELSKIKTKSYSRYPNSKTSFMSYLRWIKYSFNKSFIKSIT